jgi:hypothetical protein
MGFPVSRQGIRLRVLRDSHRQSDTGSVSLVTLNRHIQDVYSEWWWLVGNDDRSALGKSHRSLTFAADSSFLALPVEFQSLTGWRRLNVSGRVCTLPPMLIRQETALHAGWLDDGADPPVFSDARDRYYIEGPAAEFDQGLGQLVPYGLRLRAFPPFLEGETLTLTYKVQPLDLGDPEVIDTGVDLVPIELLAPPNLRNIVAAVRVRSAGRGDADEVQRSMQELRVGVAETIEALHREDRSGIMGADLFIDRSLPVLGYG